MVIIILLAVYAAMFVHTYRSLACAMASEKENSLMTFLLVTLSLSIALPFTIVSIISFFKEDDVRVEESLVAEPKEKDPRAKYENPYMYVPDDQE